MNDNVEAEDSYFMYPISILSSLLLTLVILEKHTRWMEIGQ